MDKLIQEARAALDGTTPGPWGAETVRTSCGVCHKIGPWPHEWRHGKEMSACIYDDYPSPHQGTGAMLANARFIAWTREGVPALIAALEAAQADNARLTRQLEAETERAVKFERDLKTVLDREADTYIRIDKKRDELEADNARLQAHGRAVE